MFIFPSPIVIGNYNHDPGFSIPSCRTQNLPHGEGSCISEVGSPSAIRCSGTCRVILTTSGQLTWEEHTRPITQLLMLINIRVVLFTGLRGEPTESKTSKIRGGKHLLVRSQLSLLLPNPANRRQLANPGNRCVQPHDLRDIQPHGTLWHGSESKGTWPTCGPQGQQWSVVCKSSAVPLGQVHKRNDKGGRSPPSAPG